MKNKIAIVTVHAGSTKNLIKTIDSINNQFVKPDLHLIVSKNYDNKILLYKKKYNKFIFKKDKSIYNAMNIGLKLTRDYFLFFLNSGDYLYSSNSIKIIKRFINLYKNKCINFKTILEYKKKRFLIKDQFFKKKNFFSHPSFIRPPVNKLIFYDENFKILSDGIWMNDNKSAYGIKKINSIITVHTLGGVSTNPTFLSIKDNLRFSFQSGFKEIIKYILKIFINKTKYYEIIFHKNYLIK
mgnify:CR=1 FL=1|tara:strand:+ start:953 stop:1672 length:720 start_codon:yes stop_codon:yes gene_type:complete